MGTQHLLVVVVSLFVVRQIAVCWPVLRQSQPLQGQQPKKLLRRSTAFRAPTKRPSCPGCQAAQKQPPKSPPPKIEQKRGRPRTVDTHNHYCPNKECPYYGWLGRGNIRANGRPGGGRWRQLHCTVCNKYFLETHGTVFYGRRVPVSTILLVLKSLAEGVGIRKVARIFGVDANDVLVWLSQAGDHLEAVSRYLLHDLQVEQVQLDELYALVSQVRNDPEGPDAGPTSGRKKRHLWVWAAIDPTTKLLLAIVVGDRSLAMAQMLVHLVVQALAPGVVPLFVSDQLKHYATALLTHFGQWVETPRRSKRGPHPKPRWRPLPDLLYAQVVKQRVKGRVVRVSCRVVFGTMERIEARLTRMGWKINTAFIERWNQTLRQHVAALGRRTAGSAKTEQGLRLQIMVSWAYYNFCLPHTALRVPLPQPVSTKGAGSPKLWRLRTPALAAGITDHVWEMEELLLFRVPPWRQETVA